jgi:IS30 family transposase
LLRKQLSPEQIVGYLRSINQKSFSHETIYLYIWRDKAAGGNLWTQLRGAQKKRRKRYRAYDSRGRLADKRHISERP